jgi:two-component system sensor histidine kinase FlrB
MLPSSHLAPINLSLADNQSDGQFHDCANQAQIDGNWREGSYTIDDTEMQARSAARLAGEFSEFILAASRLENSYRALQAEVSDLGLELSERNAALRASLEQNERMRSELQQIVDSMPCGVLVVDRDGEISMINPESKRLLGLDGTGCGDGTRTTLRQISARSGINLEVSYKTASSNEAEQEFCVHASSGKRWLGVRGRELFQHSSRRGVPEHTILILRDITAHKLAEQVRESGRRAMALAEIATVLAHEIRNPLASLELFAELIQTDEERRDVWISNLRAGIRSLSGTVNNVLRFHGAGQLTLTPISLSELIGNAIQFAQPLADQASVSLEWSGVHNAMRVLGNEIALRQVVLNLVSNAIRFTPEGGKVSVSIRQEHDPVESANPCEGYGELIAEFSDNGCGIRPDQIGRIFEPGFSGSGDTSGLGLAVCERIITQHGGRICASNCEPSGARFTLHFPALRTEAATA